MGSFWKNEPILRGDEGHMTGTWADADVLVDEHERNRSTPTERRGYRTTTGEGA